MANRNNRTSLLACISAVVPGLGQALRGHLGAATLLFFAALWVHAFLGAQAPTEGRLAAFLFGAPAIPLGLKTPFVVFFTLIALTLHGLSAWEIFRSTADEDGRAKEKADGRAKKAGEV